MSARIEISEARLYRPDAPELREIAARQTLARWRHEGRGPAFIKIGARIIYRGADLLEWLAAHRVTPRVARHEGSK